MRQGATPGGRRKFRVMPLIRAALVVLVAIGVVGAIALPNVRQVATGAATDLLEQARRMVAPRLEQAHPITARTSDELPDHGVRMLVDTYFDSHWEAAGRSPTVTLAFEAEEELGAVIVHNGTAQDYTERRRPARLEFIFPDGSSRAVDLVDAHDPQRIDINGPAAMTFEVRIVATNGPADQPIALSEIEFFMKR